MNTPSALAGRDNRTRGRSGDRAHVGATQEIMMELLAEVKAHHPPGVAAAGAVHAERRYHQSVQQYNRELESWYAQESVEYDREMAEYHARMSQPTVYSGHYRASNTVPAPSKVFKSKYAGTERSRRL